MGGLRHRHSFWRGVSLTLVALALVLKVAVPQGFMIADSGHSVPLVICTGHGPLVIGEVGKSKAPAKSAPEAPCAFAGSTAPPVPSLPDVIAEPFAVVAAAVVTERASSLAPGRGLAAPPPPSQAPPQAST